MASYRYDRLSSQDNGFLEWETPSLTMHGGGTQVFDAGPLATPEGGVDFQRISRAFASVLHRVPRYRQKIEWTPLVRPAAKSSRSERSTQKLPRLLLIQ